MKSIAIAVGAILVLAVAPSLAVADWFEDFDSYAAGSGLHGQGGWKGWDNNPAWDALVTDALSLSAPNSVDIQTSADIVQELSGYSSGAWVFTLWQHVPANFVGRSFVVLMNTYSDGGPYHWSCNLVADSDTGTFIHDGNSASLPLMFDEWVEINVQIDLDLDSQRVFYGGDLLTETSWTAGMSPGGALNVACLDLFGNGATSIYYDDLSLIPLTTATDESSWSQIKSLF